MISKNKLEYILFLDIETVPEFEDYDSLSEEMGKNGREAVLKKYNWELEEKKLLNLYDKLMQS